MASGSSQRASKEYPTLFHYTTIEGFEGIYRSGSFWATHFEDLNDSSELQRFRLTVEQSLRPLIKGRFQSRMDADSLFRDAVIERGGLDAVVADEAAMHLDLLHKHTFCASGLPGVFVSSFCNHQSDTHAIRNGLLSQWRGYGAGGGVAIVLDTGKIEELMERERDVFAHTINHIGNVKYDDDAGSIRHEFANVFDNLPQLVNELYAGHEPPYEAMFGHFVQGSTLTKHQAFCEEQEVRIVIAPRPTQPGTTFYSAEDETKAVKTVKHRPVRYGEARYIELFTDSNLLQSAMRCVIIGPSRNQNYNYDVVRGLVEGTSIEVSISDTPFIG